MAASPLGDLKVAIVHDWLVGGGAERVVEELHHMFPEAPIYTSYATPEWKNRLDGKVITSYLQRWPFSKLRKFVPFLRQHWFSHLNLRKYDLVISSSGNGEAKGVRVSHTAIHVCFCHSPTHFYWRHYDQYLASPGFGIFNPLARLGLKLLVGPLRKWDYKAAQRPDYIIANSSHIQADIKKFYDRESVVIHPPVDVGRFTKAAKKRAGFITVGRLVPYKNADVIIEACNQLEAPLTVVGNGPELNNLKKLAGPTISFDDQASDMAVNKYMAKADAFLFAAFEDFGITPVEAMASGTPVIAYKAGGALDYVKPGKTGLFFDKQSPESLAKALQDFPKQHFDHAAIQKTAADFSPEHFRKYMNDCLEHVVGLGHRS